MSSMALSFILKRSYATIPRPYVPPNLAALAKLQFQSELETSPSSSSSSSSSTTTTTIEEQQRIQSLIHLYRHLPKGNAPKVTVNPKDPFFVRYRAKYFTPGNESAMPLLHIILFVGGLGYTMLYFEHLSHHKQQKYH